MRPRAPSHSLGLGQVQQQRQSLTITPQLRQAIELLQLSNLELSSFLEEAVETNPLLSLDDGLRAGGSSDAGAEGEPQALSGDAREQMAPASETDGDNLWNGDDRSEPASGPGGSGPGGSGPGESGPGVSGPGASMTVGGPAGSGFRASGEELPDLSERIAAQPSLREFLDTQILVAFDDAGDRLIASLLAGRLDPSGYLRDDPVEAVVATGAEEERVREVYRRLRTFEPTGIFARDLADCLALQLAEAGRLDRPMQGLLDNLDLLASGAQAQLHRLCNATPSRLAEMVAELRSLDPRPATRFETDAAAPVVPDLLVEETAEGWRVSLNAATQPRLLIDRSFAEDVRRSPDAAARRYARDRLQEASWLVRALEQRARTLVRVGAEIVRHQQDFFDRGVEALKPLVLRQVAEAIDMHESTVSRATSGKFVETPRGVFELRFFFSAAVGGEGGEAQAAAAIRHRIRSLIDTETKPLSDDKIVQLLHQAGFDVARRTVAKYREAMRIPSSVERRRQKAIALAG